MLQTATCFCLSEMRPVVVPPQAGGMDHLDNLCKLMEQLTALREQNSNLQRRVKCLEEEQSCQTQLQQLSSAGVRKNASLSSVATNRCYGSTVESRFVEQRSSTVPMYTVSQ